MPFALWIEALRFRQNRWGDIKAQGIGLFRQFFDFAFAIFFQIVIFAEIDIFFLFFEHKINDTRQLAGGGSDRLGWPKSDPHPAKIRSQVAWASV